MNLEVLRSLIAKHKKTVLRIVYKDEAGELRTRYVRPYEIQEEKKYSYLFATEVTKSAKAIRKFRLDRIHGAEATHMTFVPVWPQQV